MVVVVVAVVRFRAREVGTRLGMRGRASDFAVPTDEGAGAVAAQSFCRFSER